MQLNKIVEGQILVKFLKKPCFLGVYMVYYKRILSMKANS